MKYITRVINGKESKLVVYGNKMWFKVTGTYRFLTQEEKAKAKTLNNMKIVEFPDDSVEVSTEYLVDFDITQNKLEEENDLALNRIEELLGIPNDALTSSSWWVGYIK